MKFNFGRRALVAATLSTWLLAAGYAQGEDSLSQCKAAWEGSSAKPECTSDLSYEGGTVTVASVSATCCPAQEFPLCRIQTVCKRITESRGEVWRGNDFTGSPNEVSALHNCNGDLQAPPC